MPAAVEMDCLIAFAPSTCSSTADTCQLNIANLDASWPGAEIKASRRQDKSWDVKGGSGKRGDWVAYLSSSLDVSIVTAKRLMQLTISFS